MLAPSPCLRYHLLLAADYPVALLLRLARPTLDETPLRGFVRFRIVLTTSDRRFGRGVPV